jgi:hypothetical protein
MLFWHLIRLVLHPAAASPWARWRSFAILPLPGRILPACRQKHAHPVNVVRQVAQTDFCLGSTYADRAQQQITRSLSLHTENVLDPRTDSGLGLVAFLFPGRQGTVAALFALDVFAKTILGYSATLILQSFYSHQRSLSSNTSVSPYDMVLAIPLGVTEALFVAHGKSPLLEL